MKKLLPRITALGAAACLAFFSISSPVLAATTQDSTTQATTAVEVTTLSSQTITSASVFSEAQKTASYVLSQTDFTDLSDTSKFYNASNRLLLAIRSGLDCSTQLAQYLSSVKSLLNSDGTLNVPIAAYAYPNDTLSSYAYLLLVLGVSGNDATNFNGQNMVTAFANQLSTKTADDFAFGYDDQTYDSTGLNPYFLGVIYDAVNAYQYQITDSSTILSTIVTALESISDENGVNYYGYSVDTNAMVYTHFLDQYEENSSIHSLITTIISNSQTNYFNSDDGTSSNYGTANSDSTALALALYSQYGYTDYAAASYEALLTYRSTTTEGAYTYSGYDSLYSSQDALIGLVTYARVLSGQTNPYNITDVLSASQTTDPTDSSDTTQTQPETTSPTTSAENETTSTTDATAATDTTSTTATTATTTEESSSSETVTESTTVSDAVSSSETVNTSDSSSAVSVMVLLCISAGIIVLSLSRKKSAKF